MVISDPYLQTQEKILNRLGAHIALAHQSGVLEWVVVKTSPADQEQSKAIGELKTRFPSVKIKFDMGKKPDHDRYIEITHTDGSQSRAIIGVGLDFIYPDGTLRKTFIVFQSRPSSDSRLQ